MSRGSMRWDQSQERGRLSGGGMSPEEAAKRLEAYRAAQPTKEDQAHEEERQARIRRLRAKRHQLRS